MIAPDGVIAQALIAERSVDAAAARLGLTARQLELLLRESGTSPRRLRIDATKAAYEQSDGDVAETARLVGVTPESVCRRLGIPRPSRAGRERGGLAEEKLVETIRVYAETGSLSETGRRLGITREAVRQRLKGAGVDTRPAARRSSPADVERARQAYHLHGTVKDTATALEIPVARARRLLDRAGVNVIPGGRPRQEAHQQRAGDAARLYAELGTQAQVAEAMGIRQTRVSRLIAKVGAAPGRGKKKVTLEQAHAAVAAAGTIRGAAAILGAHPSTVSRRLREAGIPSPSLAGAAFDDAVAETARLYRELDDLDLVAERIGRSDQTVRRRLRLAGISVPRRAPSRPTYDRVGLLRSPVTGLKSPTPQRSATMSSPVSQPSIDQAVEAYRAEGTVRAAARRLGRSVSWTRLRLAAGGEMVRTPPQPEEIEAVAAAYRAHGSVAGAARALGVSRKWAVKRLDAGGIALGKPRPPQHQIEEAARLYRETRSVQATASRLGVGALHARTLLRAADVTVPATTLKKPSAEEQHHLAEAWRRTGTIQGTARRLGVSHGVARRWLMDAGLHRPRHLPSTQDLVDVYAELGTVRAVAVRYGYGENVISKALHSAGIAVRRAGPIPAVLRETERAWRELGTVPTVAERLGVHPETVRKRLRDLDIRPQNRRITKPELDHVVEVYRETGNVAETGRRLGLAANTIRFRLAQAGVTPAPAPRSLPRLPTEQQKAEAVAAYRHAGTVTAAARQLGIGAETILRRLRAADVDPASDRARRHDDEHRRLVESARHAYQERPTIRHVAHRLDISTARASSLVRELGLDPSGDRRKREQHNQEATLAAYHRLGSVPSVAAELGLTEAATRRRLWMAGVRLGTVAGGAPDVDSRQDSP